MSNHTGVDERDPMEAIQEDVDSSVPHSAWTDQDGKVHVDHPVHTECTEGCYQVVEGGWGDSPREIDSEDGPPPRHGGPTT
ncbi:hypothetical protein [Amycolatopsis vastitatis]|uniref:Uncharacterized protein n=1 Tax=Amycolatopsis vastitatis TaxID=1905142 RepID=A0A229SPH9_9PSEU|nr:hypothetical protein [Amycolatopsis vastitatis]OXM60957.1 hypothetical protein CF165_39865 [Amycolatopsis vastitatis]